jgi:hypothetical protein
MHGITNRDIQMRPIPKPLPRACADDPQKASAKVGRCYARSHARGRIARANIAAFMLVQLRGVDWPRCSCTEWHR